MPYSQGLTLRRNFSWIFVGNLIYAVCQWGLLVVLAKMGTPHMVGQFTLGVAIAAPIILFSNLQLRTVQATDANCQYSFKQYLMLRLGSTAFALCVIAAIVAIGGFTQETAWVILMIGLAKAVEAISDLMYGCLQQHERMDWIAHSLILRGVLALIALSFGMVVGGLIGAISGLTLVWITVLLGHDFFRVETVLSISRSANKVPSQQHEKSSIQPLIHLTKIAFPLGLSSFLISLNVNIPRYVVEKFLGQETLGIFAAMTYLPIAGTMIVTALGQSTIPRLSKYYATKNYASFWQLLRRLIWSGVGMGGVGVLGAIAIGKPLLTVLYRPEYAVHTDVFVWIMVSAAIGYVGNYLGYGITATRTFEKFIVPYLLTTLFSGMMSWLLIPTFGLLGSAWTLCWINLASCLAPIIILIRARKHHEPPT